jgi:type I restriction enzyme S subunit
LPPSSDELNVAKRKLCEKEGIRNRAEVVRLDRAEWGHPIPKHWDLPNFDDLLVIVSGVTKGRVLAGRKTETVPYLRVANVQRGYLDLNVMKKIEVLPEDENRYRLETGDVLMTEGGDWDKVGRAAVWRSEIDRCIHQNHVYRIRSPRKDLLLPEWVECYVNSPVGRLFFEAASKQTTNLASINMTQLRGCPLPLPPSDEQCRIVAKVDQLMAVVNQLETQLAASRATAKNLLEALVAELTTQ